MDQDHGRGPITVALDGWTILAQHGLPVVYGTYRQAASMCDEFELPNAQGDSCFVAVTRDGELSPRLAVAQRYEPCRGGFDPGFALVPETGVFFVGAGTRLLAYSLSERPTRLWVDVAEVGFWHWSVHPPAVLMAAELELAAWTRSGEKLWSTFVEPPWSYQVLGERVRLDVMGTLSEFSVRTGPQG